jgi:signal transduction histidine kinase
LAADPIGPDPLDPSGRAGYWPILDRVGSRFRRLLQPAVASTVSLASMHRLLLQQLRAAFPPDGRPPVDIEPLLQAIEASYAQADAERERLDQRLDNASRELVDRNRLLWKELLERRQIELELRQAQKLEAVGQLAAGIAHEINTPIQYVADSVAYVRDAFGDLFSLLAQYRGAIAKAAEGTLTQDDVADIHLAEESADLDYALEQIPAAVERSMEGTRSVASIVRAMKEFAHPDTREKAQLDLNQALRNTIVVARNEIKYVADVETDFGDLPPVPCHAGDLNQVFLNLLINASHAIADAKRPDRGRITIRTRADDRWVTVRIADTGCGIPTAIRDRVFEPFFTTKDVGRGTGQGLAIARNIIVDKHQGTIDFDSELGVGTTFYIRLPLEEPAQNGLAKSA